MSERKTLLETLYDAVEYFKNRNTVGKMKTEHAVFIPSALMIQQSKETEEFVLAAREIGKYADWGCPVTAEKTDNPVPGQGKISGVEFVFTFSQDTDFDTVLEELRRRI
jgi:hypothetical protein